MASGLVTVKGKGGIISIREFWNLTWVHLGIRKSTAQSNPYTQGTGSFVFGKLNSVFYLRGGIGHQHEMFSKEDAGGIAIRYFISGGPVIGLYKPIYYRVLYPVSGTLNEYELREEKFDITIHDPTMIYSKASILKGLNETKALPGLYAKGGFNFEYSREDKVIHAIEIGAQINAFPKKIPIMASEDNKVHILLNICKLQVRCNC